MNVSGTTNGEQLEDEITKLDKLKNVKYGGMLLDPTAKMLSLIKKNNNGSIKIFFLINHRAHWTAIAKNKTWIEIDSFNRDLLGDQFDDFKLKKGNKQEIEQTDCGQRTLAKLCEFF